MSTLMLLAESSFGVAYLVAVALFAAVAGWAAYRRGMEP